MTSLTSFGLGNIAGLATGVSDTSGLSFQAPAKRASEFRIGSNVVY